ncbi:MAG: KpsF/GutQ family sugar-phosphate isomerase [Pseudomonadota bacterium]|nr:KpsF/GutQ family sugar-phosphate isomerase [Pseudomonadota bacterium]
MTSSTNSNKVTKPNGLPPSCDDLELARGILKIEANGIKTLAQSLSTPFIEAVAILQSIKGRVVLTGMGKSGHVGRKISSTLASTGTPSFFVHPGEASHGDLGMIDRTDAVIAISNSGETPEMSNLVGYTRRFRIPLIAITSNKTSTIGEQADIALVLPSVEEACPMGLAPTTSTTMTMALGDTLAVALMNKIGFSSEDFQIRHPGGQLGKRLLKVSDIMHTGENIPLTRGEELMSEIIPEMTAKSFGCIGIIDANQKLLGIITDGDLRRHMSDNILDLSAAKVMTPHPRTIRPSALATESVLVMNEAKITTLFVSDDNRVVGIIHIHDCLRAGVE